MRRLIGRGAVIVLLCSGHADARSASAAGSSGRASASSVTRSITGMGSRQAIPVGNRGLAGGGPAGGFIQTSPIYGGDCEETETVYDRRGNYVGIRQLNCDGTPKR